MDVDDGIPVALVHVEQHPVAEDPGIVDEDVESSEGVDGRVHERVRTVPVGHVVGVGDGLSAGGANLVDDGLRRPDIRTAAVDRRTDVVHDDRRALTGELERVAPADPAAGAGHDRDPSIAKSGQEVPR